MPMNEPVRLAKRVAEMVGCSRREAEQYIEGGWVTVDGVMVQEPQFRVADQQVLLSPDASLLALSSITLLLNKPPGFSAGQALSELPAAASLLTAENQWKTDKSGVRVLKKQLMSLELATPLASAASGLVVFSNDWRVLRKLREDAAVMEHEVIVEVSGDIKPGGLERMNRLDHGFTFTGFLESPAKVSWQSETRLRFALKGERPGQIAYFCESVGLAIEAMKRIRVGRVPMSHLPLGEWRGLTTHERF